MKRYVQASQSAPKVFDETSTGMSYYNNFLDPADLSYMQKSKNRSGYIDYMTSEEYFEECASKVFSITVDSLKQQRRRDAELIDKYTKAMKSGAVFPLCVIDYASPTQEGLHRMMAAGEAFGWDAQFPVLIVIVYDEGLEAKWRKQDAARDFDRYDLKDICDKAADELSDWDAPAPKNIAELFRARIEDLAQEAGVACEVECYVEQIDESHLLGCRLTSFEGLEVDMQANQSNNWLEDMFDMDEHSSDPDDDEDFDLWMFDKIFGK